MLLQRLICFVMGIFGFSSSQPLLCLWVPLRQLLPVQVSVTQLVAFRFTFFRRWDLNTVVSDSPNIGSETHMVL